MTESPVHTATALPELLPVFPLGGIILLPHGRLPLNIFEPRYLSLIEDALGNGRMVGLVQPSGEEGTPQPLYQVGCAGRIVSFAETDDGRYLVHLLGVSRFRVAHEALEGKSYRRVKPLWDDFLSDLRPIETPDYDRKRLLSVLRTYFKIQNVAADWGALQNAVGDELMSSLAMVCPLPNNEKQALLEAPSLKARADLLITLLEMACLRQSEGENVRH